MGSLAEDPAGRRSRLRLLDSHLDALEAAQARGERAIPAAVCVRLQRDVPSVTQELSIPEAMELVYREQEHHLIGARPVRAPNAVGAGGASQASLAKRDARMLTDKIKKRLNGDVSLLLREAHAGRAWASLDYRSWEEYVRREFALSRRRSYELLDHAQVMIAIGEAAGITDMPHIRPYTAIQLKPHLGQVCDAVRQAVASSPSDVAATVDAIVHEWQDLAASERAQRAQRSESAKERDAEADRGVALRLTSNAAWFDNDAIADLEAAILYLANLPSPRADRAWQLQLSERTQMMAVPRALQWLSEASTILSVAQNVAVAAS